MDDGLVFSKSKNALNKVRELLEVKFQIKICDASCFIGLEIKHDSSDASITINLKTFIERLINRFKLSDANGSSTPAILGVSLTGPDDEEWQIQYLIEKLWDL